MKKNILIVTDHFYPEEFIINDLAKQWHIDGIYIEVLTQVPSYPFDKIYHGYKNKFYSITDYEGIKVHRIRTILGYRKNVILKIIGYLYYALRASLRILIISKRFDNIFIYNQGPLTNAIPGVSAKIFRNKKITIWTQDAWPDTVFAYGFKKNGLNRFILERFVKWVYRHCDTILISCSGFESILKKYTMGKPLVWCPNWPTIYFKPVKIEKESCVDFTFAGNIGKVQNLENVITGFSLVNSDKKIRLNIVGDGSHLGYLKKIVKENNISNVIFMGRKNVEEMPDIYNRSDFLIISLDNEPIFSLTVPSKFQTYLVAKKPIFSVMNGEVANMVKDNKIGVIADPDDVQDVKKGFEYLINLTESEKLIYIKNMSSFLDNEYNRNIIIKRITDQVLN